MSATAYRWLIRLHPRAFRERYGDEMCCAFDEAGAGSAPFFLDGLASLARQWLFRSGIWKPAAGLVISALFLFAWAFFVSAADASRIGRSIVAEQTKLQARVPLNRAEFNEEAAQAVAMLAHFRKVDELKAQARDSRSDSRAPHDSPRN